MIKYRCTGGIAGTGVDLEARMTPQVSAGRMDVRWDMSYKGLQRFGSPGFFPEGSILSLQGVVKASGAWNGQLEPRGDKTQGQLVPGSYLDLPEGLTDGAALDRSGKIRFEPAGLSLKFTPAEGDVKVNSDDSTDIQYTGAWQWVYTAATYDDYQKDIRWTEGLDATAKLEFLGTKVSYIGRREQDLSKIRVKIDGQEVTSGLVEPGKDGSGAPMTGTKSQEVLWTSPQLDYGPHTIEIINTESKRAYLDAFQVFISDVPEPPEHDKTTCTMQNDPGAIDVTIPGSTPTDTGSPTPTDTGTDDPTDPPTDPPTDDPDDNPGTGDNGSDDYDGTIGGDQVRVVTPTSTSTTTATVTPKSTGPTATKYYRAQVANTPSGGVETGVAPDEEKPPFALLAGGMAFVMGTAGGGLLLRRRKAEHAGGAL
ncbi:hypothetical protein FXF51_50785 [Nonomuraea sp. PA05]|uniref:hypothetical protein n=1 Tax=Nonomuraea sp. PA05 TaxID=2604466 RepID=UPI0011D67E49|nr:hypothetical protein [Nonomuraea sp. PA05]TYB52762.1 hypothetical protein FXF51_50785 [Nonomuraea sp. PA05]